MIRGMHGLFYSSEPEALRAFFRDKLGFPCYDVGDGWLIFDAPAGDFGVHPTEHAGQHDGIHSLSFFCDDIEATVAELRARGVEFTSEPRNEGWGITTAFAVPGGAEIMLYQPLYSRP